MEVNLFTFNFKLEIMIKSIYSNTLKSFFLKLFIFFFVVFIADRLLGAMLKKYYFKQEAGYDYLTTYALEKTSAELVTFGSSRAANIFNTGMFEMQMGLSCFNAGRYGEPIFYHYAVLKTVLERYKPKMILLSFDAGNFSINQESYDRIASLLPYYNDHPEIRDIVALKGPFEKIKLLSSIYPYNSLLLSIVSGNTASSKKKFPHLNGYIANKKIFTGELQTIDYSKETALDSIKITAYKAFIQDCEKAKIPLYIICPPYLINSIGTDASIIEAKKIAKENYIEFLDYSRDTFFSNRPRLFEDFRHLNETGVEIFCNILIKKLSSASVK